MELNQAIESLESVRESCYQGISGEWEPTSDGFQAMADSVTSVINFLKEMKAGDPQEVAAIKRLTDEAEAANLDPLKLDDAVHDAALHIGSNINNGGLSRQIEFLVKEEGIDGATETVREAIKGSK